MATETIGRYLTFLISCLINQSPLKMPARWPRNWTKVYFWPLKQKQNVERLKNRFYPFSAFTEDNVSLKRWFSKQLLFRKTPTSAVRLRVLSCLLCGLFKFSESTSSLSAAAELICSSSQPLWSRNEHDKVGDSDVSFVQTKTSSSQPRSPCG